MSDLISREALRREIYKDMAIEDNKRVTQLLQAIMDAPTIEAEPVRHGKWVKAQGMMPPEYHHRKCCNLCGGWALQDFFGRERMSFYCPNCGAKMDGGAEDDHQGT